MTNRIKKAFLLLVLVQALHSIEEYFGKLWDVLLPARFLCSLVSDDLEKGFVTLNIGIFVVGILCWLFPVRRNYRIATGIIWIWVVVEISNGIMHPAMAIYNGSYFPGVITAPVLLGVAIYLAFQLSQHSKEP